MNTSTPRLPCVCVLQAGIFLSVAPRPWGLRGLPTFQGNAPCSPALFLHISKHICRYVDCFCYRDLARQGKAYKAHNRPRQGTCTWQSVSQRRRDWFGELQTTPINPPTFLAWCDLQGKTKDEMNQGGVWVVFNVFNCCIAIPPGQEKARQQLKSGAARSTGRWRGAKSLCQLGSLGTSRDPAAAPCTKPCRADTHRYQF